MNIDKSVRLFGQCRNRLAQALAALLLVSFSPMALAQSGDSDRFSLSVGVFVTERDSKTRLDGSVPGSGTDIDLESDLGLDKTDSVFRIDGYFRFSESQRIDFSAFELSRSATADIDRDIEWDGIFYPVNTTVSSNFELNVYKVAYSWAFMQREDSAVGVSAGLYVADFGTSLAAESIGETSGNGVTAPLPVLGVRGHYDFTDRLSLRGSGEFFALEYGDYSGSLYDLYAGVDYQVLENFGVGIGINSVRLDVGVDKTGFNGDLNWTYTGALLFAKFNF